MIVTDPRDIPTGSLPVVIIPEAQPGPSTVRPRFEPRRLVMGVVVAVVLLIALGLLFEGPVEHIWYQARQQALAADLNVKRAGVQKDHAVGVIQIPSINLDLVIVEGDGPTELRGGPGHRSGTPLPGQLGNSLVFGHRKGWGAPFRDLSQVQVNGYIVLKKRTDLEPILFRVISAKRVSAGDTRPFANSTDHRLTLVTSDGSGRLVVTAVSGNLGTLSSKSRAPATTPYGSPLFNATVGLLILLVGGAVLAVKRFRPRYNAAVVAAITTPLVLAALLAFFLECDLVAVSRLH
jgi:sortase A